jgi:hypothetical protein
MNFMAGFPRIDDIVLRINAGHEEGEVDLTLHDDVLNTELTYTVNLDDLKLALRKLACK